MDETTYSDSRVIAAINEHFVPIRVDNDRYPDVNRRYNMGGWPTTAFLSAGGDVLTGGTYLPPDQMLESLASVKAFFDANPAAILALESERATAGDTAAMARFTGLPTNRRWDLSGPGNDPDLPDDIATEVALLVVRGSDRLHGGLGTEPKFPQPDAFGFLLAYATLRDAAVGDENQEGGGALRTAHVYEVLRTTLTALASRDLYDAIEGGFFRYATRRDWTVPHYEKMLDDNARLARLYLQASVCASSHDLGDPALYRRVAEGTIDYLLTTLRSDDAPAFGGSQDADERYYLLDEEGRAALQTPYVDPTVYVDWNAQAARALLLAAPVLDRPELTGTALRLLDHLYSTARRSGAMVHYVDSNGETGSGAPLLSDQVATAAAFLDAYESTGGRRWLHRAEGLADWLCDRFLAPDGRLIDRLTHPGESAGLLAQPAPALDENAAVADLLLRLEIHTGEPRFRRLALEILAAWATRHEQYGVAASCYGKALLRYIGRGDDIVVVGRRDDPEARALHTAALTVPNPLRSVSWLDPSDADDATRLTEMALPSEPGDAAAAFVCRARACSRFDPQTGTGAADE